jgi:DnaJ-domain-containing protein 1
MPDGSNALLWLLLAGVGVALFFAGREFMRGIKEGRDEHRARSGQEQESCRPDDSEHKAQRPHPEGSQLKPWYEVLEVTPRASPEEIKGAYRRMMTLYHPDRVDGLGLELRVVAERRAKEINEAYAAARKLRGF